MQVHLVNRWFSLALFVAGVAHAIACASPATPVAPPVAPRPVAVLVAGPSGNYPPLSARHEEHFEGFAPALLSAFAADQSVALEWRPFRWPELSSDLQAGRFAIAADGITVTPERSVAGRFTVPIARGGAVLLLRRPSWARAAQGIAELDRPELRVAVNRGGYLERVARSRLHAAEVRALADNSGVRDALARGEVDAAMTNTFEAPRWAAGLADVEAIGPLTSDITALWVRPDEEELAERIDAWLLGQEESGRLGALRRLWLDDAAGPASATPASAVLAATVERLSLMPFVAAAKKRAGSPIEDAAQEERVLAASASAVARAAQKRGVPAPPAEVVNAFFRAQIEAAKSLQGRGDSLPQTPAWSLEQDLRPAIARITARLAWLVVRIPRDTTNQSVGPLAQDMLGGTGLDPEHVGAIAAALAAFAR
jgi:cyclohexadienyl dehydratase